MTEVKDIIRYSGIEWNIDNATVWISPFEDFKNIRTDYDWCPYPCGKKFKQDLYDILGNQNFIVRKTAGSRTHEHQQSREGTPEK